MLEASAVVVPLMVIVPAGSRTSIGTSEVTCMLERVALRLVTSSELTVALRLNSGVSMEVPVLSTVILIVIGSVIIDVERDVSRDADIWEVPEIEIIPAGRFIVMFSEEAMVAERVDVVCMDISASVMFADVVKEDVDGISRNVPEELSVRVALISPEDSLRLMEMFMLRSSAPEESVTLRVPEEGVFTCMGVSLSTVMLSETLSSIEMSREETAIDRDPEERVIQVPVELRVTEDWSVWWRWALADRDPEILVFLYFLQYEEISPLGGSAYITVSVTYISRRIEDASMDVRSRDVTDALMEALVGIWM